MGNATRSIVTPLESGVIKAAKKKIAMTAKRQYLRHVEALTRVAAVSAYITIGSSNVAANPNVNTRVNPMNWSRLRNFWRAPREPAMLYRKRNVKGRRTKNARRIPATKRKTAGTTRRTMTFRSRSYNAGAMNFPMWYATIGIPDTRARKRADWSCTTNASVGPRTTGVTSGGTR